MKQQKQRRQKLLMTATEARGQAIQRGMIRYLELVFDVSKAAGMNDMRPIRSAAMFHAAEEFIRSFFDENPLSQLGIILLKDGVALQLTELSSSPVRIVLEALLMMVASFVLSYTYIYVRVM